LVGGKTGTNELQADQLECYLDIARRESYDALVTISNEVPAIAGQHPTKVDRPKLNRVEASCDNHRPAGERIGRVSMRSPGRSSVRDCVHPPF
jgi:hypothetical protein